MAPAVVSDSSVSLPPEAIEGLPLFLAPLEVRVGGRVYADGVDLTPARFYELLAESREPPTTSAPTPGAFLAAFERARAVSGEVLCVTLSAELSATHRSAVEAAALAEARLPGLRVVVVDSRSAGAALGLIALDAARAAAGGASLDETAARVRRRMADTELLGYLRTLRHLRRSGRAPLVLLWAGALLDVKPVLRLADGAIGMIERPRTEARAMRRLVARAEAILGGRPGRVAVFHASAPEQAALLADALRGALDVAELLSAEITPVIGAHTGPGLVGCALHPADDP